MRPKTEIKFQEGKTILDVTFPKGTYDVGCLAIDNSFQQLTDDLRSILKDCIRQVLLEHHSALIIGIADFGYGIRLELEDFREDNDAILRILDNNDLKDERVDVGAAYWSLEGEAESKGKNTLQGDIERVFERSRTERFLEYILSPVTHQEAPCKDCGRGSWPIIFRDPSSPGRRGLSHQVCPTCEVKHRRSQTLDRVRKHREKTPKKRGIKPKRRRSPL